MGARGRGLSTGLIRYANDKKKLVDASSQDVSFFVLFSKFQILFFALFILLKVLCAFLFLSLKDMEGAIELLPDRLYYLVRASNGNTLSYNHKQNHFFSTDSELIYWYSFFAFLINIMYLYIHLQEFLLRLWSYESSAYSSIL